jgi:hypothetical protein
MEFNQTNRNRGDVVNVGLPPSTAPIDPKLEAEVRKTRDDAAFGYTTVTCQIYSRHVGALLAELDRVRAELAKAPPLYPGRCNHPVGDEQCCMALGHDGPHRRLAPG